MAPKQQPPRKTSSKPNSKPQNSKSTKKAKQTLVPHSSRRPFLPPPPQHWPGQVTYLYHPYYPKTLPQEIRKLINPPTSTPPIFTPPHPAIRIKPITSPQTHPALNQHGLFTTSALPPGTHLLDYLGRVHDGPDADSDASDYDLSLDREVGRGVGVDASRWGNEGRFLNDYRGVDDVRGANCEFYDVSRGGERRVGVRVGRRVIAKGEELLVSYGKGFWRERGMEGG